MNGCDGWRGRIKKKKRKSMGKRKWSGREQFATLFPGSLLGPRALLQRVREDRVKSLGTRLNNLSISTTSAKKNTDNEQRKVVYFWYYCNNEPRSLTAGFSNNLSRSSSFYLKAGITKKKRQIQLPGRNVTQHQESRLLYLHLLFKFHRHFLLLDSFCFKCFVKLF